MLGIKNTISVITPYTIAIIQEFTSLFESDDVQIYPGVMG